jgi:hypothetical protein
VTVRVVAVSVVVAGLVLAAAAFTGLSLERAVLLAPALVIAAAAVVGLVVFWSRVALQSLRQARRPRLIVALTLLGLAVIVALTLLGVKLPHE